MRKNLLQENFDLTINFDFFDLITLEWLMVSTWNLVCGRFVNFWKGKKFCLYWLLVALIITKATSYPLFRDSKDVARNCDFRPQLPGKPSISRNFGTSKGYVFWPSSSTSILFFSEASLAQHMMENCAFLTKSLRVQNHSIMLKAQTKPSSVPGKVMNSSCFSHAEMIVV